MSVMPPTSLCLCGHALSKHDEDEFTSWCENCTDCEGFLVDDGSGDITAIEETVEYLTLALKEEDYRVVTMLTTKLETLVGTAEMQRLLTRAIRETAA